MFWPGVAVPHAGVTPGLYTDFNPAITPDGRVDTVLGWLDLPAPRRPRFLTLYFEAVDSAGHHHGPASPEVNAAMTTIDTAIGRLVAGLKSRGQDANLIVVADHGMAAVGPENVVLLDDLIGTADASHAGATVVFDGTIVGVTIPATPAGQVARQRLLATQPHMQCWDKGAIPAALHYGTNPRVPDVVCQVATGWLALTREERARTPALEKGAHGYAIDDPAMAALFIAQGPAFRTGAVIPPFPNVDVYPLMAKVLGITPLANDGTLADLAGALAPKSANINKKHG
jgi:predicted AlkP superfamily pyrophosphatase or phosphodiesterase